MSTTSGGDIFIDIGLNTGLAEQQIQALMQTAKGKKIILDIDMANLQKQMASAMKEINNAKAAKIKLEADKSSFKSSLNEMEQSILKLKENRIELKADKSDIQNEIYTLKAAIREISNEKITLQINKNAIDVALSDLKTQFATVSISKLKEQSTIDALTSSKLKYEQELKSLETQGFSKGDANYDNVKNQLDDVISRLSTARQAAEAMVGVLKQLQAAMDEISKPKIEIDAQMKEADNAINLLKQDLNDANTALDETKSKISSSTSEIEKATNEKNQIKLVNEEELRKKEDAINETLNAAKQAKDELAQQKVETKSEYDFDKATEGAKNLSDANKELTAEQIKAADGAGKHAEKIKTLSDYFNSLSKMASTASSVVNSIGTTLGSNKVYSGITSLFSSGVNYLKSNMTDAVELYDTYKTFPQYMSLIGVSTDQSNAALEKMYNTVKGTAVSFSDVVSDAQKYAMILGDVNKGTNLALGINTLYTLGGSDASGTYKNTLQRLIVSGTLETNRQWNTMVNAMGAGAIFVARQLGIESGNVGELLKGVQTGASNEKIEAQMAKASETARETLAAKLEEGGITGQQFIDAIVAVQESGELEALTNISKGTIEGSIEALKLQVTQGEKDMLNIVDESLKQHGSSLTKEIDNFRVMIQDAFTAVGEYVGQHPEIIQNLLNGFKSLLSGLGEVAKEIGSKDIAGTIEKLFEGLRKVIDIGSSLIGNMSPELWANIVVWAPWVSKALSALSSVFNILGGLKIPTVATTIFSKLKSLFGKSGVVTEAVEELSDTQGLERWQIIRNMYGKNGTATKATEALAETATSTSSGLKNFKSVMEGEAEILGGIVLIGGFIADIKLLVSTLQDISNLELSDDFDAKAAKVSNIAIAITAITGVIVAIMSAVSKSKTALLAVAGGELLTGGLALIIGQVAEDLKTFAEAYKAAVEAVEIASKIDPDAVSQEKLSKISQAIENLAAATKDVDPPKNADDFKSFAEGLQKYIEILPQLQNLDVDAEKISAITEKFKGEKGIGQSLEDLATEIGGLNFTYNTGGIVDFSGIEWKTGMISSILYKIQEDYNAVTSLNIPDVDVGDNSMLGKAVNNLVTIKKKIAELGSVETSSTGIASLSDVEWNIGMIASSLYKVQNVQSALDGIQSLDTKKVAQLKTDISTIMDDLNGAFGEDGAWALEAKAGTMLSAVNKIQELMVATTTLGNGGGNLQSLTSGVEELEKKATEAKGKVDELNSSIDALNGKTVTATINVETTQAQSNVANLQSQINGLTGTTVTIGAVISGGAAAIASQLNTIGTVNQANGGIVPEYHAKGGFATFVPRGTDTVPAMLTPGEYVIRRGVASVLGKDTLDKLNKMDFVGAMANMGMNKMYNNYNTTNVHNTTNNRSANVVQNIYNQGESYSYMRAGKFVERLASL